MMRLGYRDVKSKSYTHSYLPGIGVFTYAPNNSNCSSDSRGFLDGATILRRLRYVKDAPSRYLVEKYTSSYGT